jgi:hypothetical protein
METITKKRAGFTKAQKIAYILAHVNSEGRDTQPTTDKEKAAFLMDTFKGEHGYNIPRLGMQRAISEWLRGLPSSFTVTYWNHEIIQEGIEMGYLTRPDDKRADKFVENWFDVIAWWIMQTCTYYKV